MGNNELFQSVRQLDLPHGTYALFGSAPLGIRGLRECQDIDIIVTEALWHTYAKKEGWERGIRPHGSEYLSRDGIELWKDWVPGEWHINELIRNAEEIDGLPFVRLEAVLESKRRMSRPKDIEDIARIEQYLAELPYEPQ